MKQVPDKNRRREGLYKVIKQSRTKRQYVMGTLFLILLPLGWFYPVIGYFIPFCMLVGIGLAIRKGRSWCNWMCPRGSFADSYLKLISRKAKVPRVFRTMPLRVLVLAFLMSMMFFQIVSLWPDPMNIGRLFMTLLTITTVVGVLLAIFVHQRTWCYICPIGTISSWVGRNKNPLELKADTCTHCNACNRACPMNLSPQVRDEEGEMRFKGDCLKCELCTHVCPPGVLSFQSE